MIRVAVLSLLTASAAQAETPDLWDSFLSRCLQPVEELGTPRMEGLAPSDVLPGWWEGSDTSSGHLLTPSASFVLTGAEEQIICALGTVDAAGAEALRQEFDRWSQASGENAYVRLNPDAAVFESFEWREPIIRVGFVQGASGEGAYVYVHETDLEA